MNIKYLPAKNYTKANRKPADITLVVIHTAECGESSKAAENLQSWTAGANASQASWHYAVDNDSITQSCLEKDVAWHASAANGFSVGIEHAGYAAQDAKGWADDYSLAVLELSAQLLADICRRNSIPPVRLSAEDLAAGKRSGICGHVDVTNGLMKGKGHQDPGKAFPWDAYLARVCTLLDVQPEATERAPVNAPGEITTTKPFEGMVEVECQGVTWEVSPVYYGPVGIGEARELAASMGCELPTPELVDAIYAAADLKIDATQLVFTAAEGNDFGARMFAPETYEKQAQKLGRIIGDRALGQDYYLLAGAFKDVVQRRDPATGSIQIGIYGWHRANGVPIQPFFAGHSLAWKDYSQGLRLVRRKA